MNEAYLPDLLDLARRREDEIEKALARLPVCCECNEPIQDDTCFEFDGEFICPRCLTQNHRKFVDDLID
jgi:formylmethanofuran dehydrogenase subunit E